MRAGVFLRCIIRLNTLNRVMKTAVKRSSLTTRDLVSVCAALSPYLLMALILGLMFR
jgi:hypothetical protein